jgi:hypothetical protein
VIEGEPLRDLAERLRTLLFEADGVLGQLPPEVQEQLHHKAQTLAAVGWKPVLGYVYSDFLVESVSQGFACGLKIEAGLEIHPELCLHPKKSSQA